jgi:hypothetical protein
MTFFSYADSLPLSSVGAAKGLNIAVLYRTIDVIVDRLLIATRRRDGRLNAAHVCRHTGICLRF